MLHPVIALVGFAVLAALAALLWWPRRGLVPRISRIVRMTERVRFEDGLKHLYHAEYDGHPATVDELAGALGLSRLGAVRLAARLESLGFVRTEGTAGEPRLALTAEGRAYAIRVVRTHRLWERYLADRTGVSASEWHERAEVKEHELTAEDVDRLSARMGHPRFDPHGDPIPTAEGKLPPPEGIALTALPPGQAAAIVHLEDEPTEVFHRLVADGLSPGMRVHVLEAGAEEVRFKADGKEHTLPPVVAANITVMPLADAEVTERPHRSLADLSVGETGVVSGISVACQGLQRRRLLDLGVVPGTRIQARMRSPLGDPVAYDVRGALVALRRRQALWIQLADSV